ncbi:MAG: fibronectin type III domain-containing protein [Myxococcales bacterium]
MHDPRWRDAVAYGLAEGLAKFFDPTKHAPPPRPDGLRAVNLPDGTLQVSWNQVAGAQGYLLYVLDSPDAGKERAFDAGRFVGGVETVVTGLTPRKTYAFRVAAVDSNGVGYPSQAVAARFRGAKNLVHPAAEALVVGAYDRRDAWVQEIDNDGAYSVEHAQALAAGAPAVFFDGALDEAVVDGSVPMASYRLVDYAAGKDSVEHESISQPMQTLLSAYLAAGGALLVSGEEVAYDLVSRGDATDKAFAASLGLGYAADDADTFSFDAVAGGPFDGLGSFTFDDGTKGVYRVEYPDVLAAVAGKTTAAMKYPAGGIAALASDQVIAFGMGLETVVPFGSRAQIFGKAVAHLVPDLAGGDLDLDGMLDSCETQYGFDPTDAADGAQDADGDGVSNAAECQAGTDPRHGPSGLDAGMRPDATVVVLADAGQPGLDAATEPASDASGQLPDGSTPGSDASTSEADASGSAGDASGWAGDASLSGSDASTALADAGTAPKDASVAKADAGPVAPPGGCGCSASASPTSAMWLVLVGLAGLGRRRR